MERNHADILKAIVDTGELSDELIEQLNTAVTSFKDGFKPEAYRGLQWLHYVKLDDVSQVLRISRR